MLSNCKRAVKLNGWVIRKIFFDREITIEADTIIMSVKDIKSRFNSALFDCGGRIAFKLCFKFFYQFFFTFAKVGNGVFGIFS